MSSFTLYFRPVRYAWAMLKRLWWKLNGWSELVPGAEWARRQELCHGCKFYKADTDECGACGCPVDAKTPLASEECPKRFWMAFKRKK